MIGSVSITRHGTEASAALHEDGTWTYAGSDTGLVDHLRFSVSALDCDDEGPSQGPFGAVILHTLAASLEPSTIHFEEKIRAEPGTIF